MPCDVIFTDSSEYASILMNSSKTSVTLAPRIQWLGRSGVHTVKGIKIAYVNGVDSDILGTEVQKSASVYVGNYFTQADIDKVVAEAAGSEVDLLIAG